MKGKRKGKSSVLCLFSDLQNSKSGIFFFYPSPQKAVFLDQKGKLYPGSGGFFPAWFFALVNDISFASLKASHADASDAKGFVNVKTLTGKTPMLL